jgi:two-component system LytT family response regulator
MRAYLVDDEPLAVARLRHLLDETGRVDIVGSAVDPRTALEDVRRTRPDVLFLDIEMPGTSGFDLLEGIGEPQPLVVFTTAYAEYALEAFKVNSIDYLLKPVERVELDRALSKLERILDGGGARGDLTRLLGQVREALSRSEPEFLVRVAARVGERVELVDVADVTFFYAKDKLTMAVTAAREHALDTSIAELEQRLPTRLWVRIHRSTLVNVDAVKELRSWFGGKLLVKLKDGRTELQVARERVAEVRAKLGL